MTDYTVKSFIWRGDTSSVTIIHWRKTNKENVKTEETGYTVIPIMTLESLFKKPNLSSKGGNDTKGQTVRFTSSETECEE